MQVKSPLRVELTAEKRAELERRSRAFGEPYRDVLRARVILGLAEGQGVGAVGRELQMARQHVRKWGQRFVRKRLAGLEDEPRSGRPPRFSPGGGRASGEAGLRAA
jgi:hypothetical protein